MSLTKILAEIEAEFEKDPYLVWEFLEEDDLLITRSNRNSYIIGVRKYLKERRMIAVKFIYSLQTDTFYQDSGLESPEIVERGPSAREVEQLRTNVDYLTFVSGNQ